ncbi:amino acid adenylation domain-containing protein [Streptomyces lucensis]|nr:amino acid adenylation domain-containing protein [Streptomyces lucensis]
MDVPHRVLAQASAHPDAPAVVEDGSVTSYRQLVEAAAGIAGALQRRGIRPGGMVAVHLDPGSNAVAAQLGVWLSGAVSLMLPPGMPEARMAAIVEDAAPEAVVLDSASSGAKGLRETPSAIDLAGLTGPGMVRSAPVVPRPPDGEGSAYLIYTSGSTGVPKGVLVGHRSFARLITWHGRTYDVTPADRASSVAAMSFDAYLWEVWPYLCHGASVHFAPPEIRLAPWELGDWYKDERISLSFLPTPLAEAYLRHGTHFDALRCLLTGGDRLRLTQGHPVRRFVNHYGLSETTVVATSHEIAAHEQGAISIGRPIDSARVLISDGRREVPPGEPGELLLGGDCPALRYWRDPVATERSFVGLEGRDGRWYRSGDLVRLDDDGNLVFLGRIDRQIKVRGVRVEPGEVEGVLGRHPQVDDVVVDWDDEEARLTAYVVGSEDTEVAQLEALARRALPGEMVPQRFLLVNRLPLTPHGKVDRRELRRSSPRSR